MIVLIPAYEPDARLVTLVTDLGQADPGTHIIVVDDGSGAASNPVFDAVRALGAEVIGHPANQGKGYSLKVGFRHILTRYPGADVVSADSDGQHRVRDILRVAARVEQHAGRPGAPLVLGGRRFTGQVPLRSRLGNTLARQAFRFTTAQSIHDTQTGLRGYPAALLEGLIGVEGDRFEYELNTLLEASAAGRAIDEIAIETVYLDGNRSSHFRPVVDSLRVMRPLLIFGAVSFGSFLVDLVALQVLVGHRFARARRRRSPADQRQHQLPAQPHPGLQQRAGLERRTAPTPGSRRVRGAGRVTALGELSGVDLAHRGGGAAARRQAVHRRQPVPDQLPGAAAGRVRALPARRHNRA